MFSSLFTTQIVSLSPVPILSIGFDVSGDVDLLGPFNLVPMAGNWSSGLNVASLDATLSVGIPNMSIYNPLPSMAAQVTVASASISNGQYTFNCVGVQLENFGNARSLICKLPCAPGGGYKLTVRFCWNLSSKVPLTLNVGPSCFNVTAVGEINFPAPVFVPGTLLPLDGRPYVSGGGQSGANPTSQLIPHRSSFVATVGVQHLCKGPWASFQFGNANKSSPIACVLNATATPPDKAVRDYSTLACTAEACSESACPDRTPMFVKMNYSNFIATTADSLVDLEPLRETFVP